MIELTIDGDKSLSHRYLLFSSLIGTQCKIRNLNKGRDVATTLRVLTKLGMHFEKTDQYLITDSSYAYSKDLHVPLNCENSGTTMRLLAGILAAKEISTKLIGDASLSKRPMKRIIKPLNSLGARIKSKQGMPPLGIFPPIITHKSHLIELEIASAQVKSSVLLFAYLKGLEVNIKGKILSRDHTEILLKQLGADLYINQGEIQLHPSSALNDFEVKVPGDFSSAMFLIVYRLLVPGKTLSLKNILLNPTRSYSLDLLKEMGANIKVENEKFVLGEKCGDLQIDYSTNLHNLKSIGSDKIALIIDEIPILSLLFSRSKGSVELEQVQELKFKESNRLSEITQIFPAASIEGNNLKIIGDYQKFTKIQSIDHRILMTQIIAQAIESVSQVEHNELKNIEISYPDFMNHLLLLVNESLDA